MNVILFGKPNDGPERRLAEFLMRPKIHVHVYPQRGVEHSMATDHFDNLDIDLEKLRIEGFTQLRLEVVQPQVNFDMKSIEKKEQKND